MSAVIVALLILIGIVHTVAVIHFWPILADPDHYTREATWDLTEHIRFFGGLPRPDREWNR